MIISFFSNYLTHHQTPFCEEMKKLPGVEFHFISTEPMENERINCGWALAPKYNYELKAYECEENEKEALRLALDSHVIIIGSAPEKYVEQRMKYGKEKLTLRYGERIYKKGRWHALSPKGAYKRWQTYFKYYFKPIYMLCASAYAAGDLAILGSYLQRCYKWGYFPEVKRYEDVDNVIAAKRPASILWVARLIGLKHPGASIQVAKRLKESGYTFEINLIGSGELEGELRQMIADNGLEDCVHMLGAMSPEKVREHMEQSEIFLFTSDRNEGWGAVLNESMNSACAVVASGAIGSVPFLIENGKNGLVYQDGNIDDLTEKVKMLLDNPDKRNELGKQAYLTMTEQWNAENAAKRLIELINAIQSGRDTPFIDGVCSKAE